MFNKIYTEDLNQKHVYNLSDETETLYEGHL